MQGLGGAGRGFNRGATMSGNRADDDGARYFTVLTIGQTSWTAPEAGFYTFTAIGPGYYATNSTNGGKGGGAAQIRKRLAKGDVVTTQVGFGAASGGSATDTMLSFSDGAQVNVLAATSSNVGAASGGDMNVQGNVNVSGIGGAGPTIGEFIGAPSFLAGGVQPTQGMPIGAGGSHVSGANYSGGTGAIYVAAS